MVDPVVHTDEIARTVYATDNSIYQVQPAGVALPATRDEVVALVASNAASASPQPIVARGGGTGTNGQSLTNGVIVDLKRNLNQVVSIDPEARTAVVEPGVVAGELNAALAAHGLFWAPHTSTLNRATVGGMIATDAAGKGSLVHGRAHRHVLALDVVLADGSVFRAEAVPVAEAQLRAAQSGRAGEVWQALLDLPVGEGDTFDLPELARGFSGYGLDRLRRDGLVDPLALLVGAEGTLGITTRATLRLTPLAKHTTLVVAAYPSFAAALEDAVALRATGPTAIETFDERTLAAGRASPAWSALGNVLGDLEGAVLLLEYEADAPIDPGPIEAAIVANARATTTAVLGSPSARADAWKVRADAVGLLAKIEVGAPMHSARPTAMVEDCAVPVEAMVDFIADFRAVLDGFGLEYAMFGHADVGCVHVRPALDTTDPEHAALVRSVTDAVTATVKRHGGVLWGEHGRGFRGDVASEFLSGETIAVMRRVKSIFDPDDLMNPGKLYRPAGSTAELTALDEPTLRGDVNRSIPVQIRNEYANAFACNGNGLCHHYDPADAMCPSFKATGDPALSPKGRADLLRSFLVRREAGGDPEFDEAVAANLSECLSCSACSGMCPVEVDIPELKSQFLEAYYQSRKRPRSHRLLSEFESIIAVASRSPKLAAFGAKWGRRGLGLVDLPAPKPPTLINTFPTFKPTDAAGRFDVVLLTDAFTAYLEPDTLDAAGEVLASLGLRVGLSPFVPSGKFDHVKGKRTEFANAVGAQAELVNSITAAGAIAVAIEPATALLHSHEYPRVDPGYPTAVRHVVDVLHDHLDQLRENPTGNGQAVSVLGHCTERATRPESLAKWQTVLEAAGFEVSAPALGCCGMAGIFGHEADNQEMSRALWDMGWGEAVDGAAVAVATGYSCRSQAERFGSSTPPHPVHLLYSSLHDRAPS